MCILNIIRNKRLFFMRKIKLVIFIFLLEGAVKAYKVDRFDNEIFFGIFKMVCLMIVKINWLLLLILNV